MDGELQPITVGKKTAAQLLGLSVRTIEYLISQRKIAARKVGRRTLIPYRALQEFARRDTPTIDKPSRAKESDEQ